MRGFQQAAAAPPPVALAHQARLDAAAPLLLLAACNILYSPDRQPLRRRRAPACCTLSATFLQLRRLFNASTDPPPLTNDPTVHYPLALLPPPVLFEPPTDLYLPLIKWDPLPQIASPALLAWQHPLQPRSTGGPSDRAHLPQPLCLKPGSVSLHSNLLFRLSRIISARGCKQRISAE